MNEPAMTTTEILRKWLVFQLKLAADALRDVLFSPISTIVLLVDLVQRNSFEQSYFRRLMRQGRRSDHFINLFDHSRSPGTTIDKVVDDAERRIRGYDGDSP